MALTADLIFPELATNFSQTLSSLKRSTLSIHNRLSSIIDDSRFVCAVSEAFDLPLIANERCGSWYIPPGRKAGSAYFKSTDGHVGQWAFSFRRLNLQILDTLAQSGGCIIVDSTRRGKSMPDALSKTLPIWCAVINRIAFPDDSACLELHTPPGVVSKSEHSQIESLLPKYMQQFDDLKLDLFSLRQKIRKPLRPIWITRDSILPECKPSCPEFYSLVLCTSSKRVHGGEISEGGYIQGAGDDSEAWSHGLTPSIFWSHKDELLTTPEHHLPDFIAGLLRDQSSTERSESFKPIPPTNKLLIGTIKAMSTQAFGINDIVISCGPEECVEVRTSLKLRYLHLQCRKGKLGSRDLRAQIFLRLPSFVGAFPQPGKIFVSSLEGTDFSIGAALAVLCLYFESDGSFRFSRHLDDLEVAINKKLIRQRLTWITTRMPEASLCRATLNAVTDLVHRYQHRRRGHARGDRTLTNSLTTLSSSMTAEIIFSNLLGSWELYRTFQEYKRHEPHLPPYETFPAGVAHGTITFEALDTLDLREYRYTEQGIYQKDDEAFAISQSYIWKLETARSEPTIAVYLVNREDETMGNLYGRLRFDLESPDGRTYFAESHCDCQEDKYDVTYEFELDLDSASDRSDRTALKDRTKSSSTHSGSGSIPTASLSQMIITNEVRGPRKDYQSVTIYRPQNS